MSELKNDIICLFNERIKRIEEEFGTPVFYMGLHGSQNYNLHDEDSDIDCKAVVFKTKQDILKGVPFKQKLIDEYGEIEIKDIFEFDKVLSKGNVQFIETVNTQYYIGNPEPFRLHKVNAHAVRGALIHKYEALTRGGNVKAELIDRYGFDPKQYHHMLRWLPLIEMNLTDSVPYTTYDDNSEERAFLMDIKRNKYAYTYNDIKESADKIRQDVNKIIPESYKYLYYDNTERIMSIMQQHYFDDV